MKTHYLKRKILLSEVLMISLMILLSIQTSFQTQSPDMYNPLYKHYKIHLNNYLYFLLYHISKPHQQTKPYTTISLKTFCNLNDLLQPVLNLECFG